MITCTLFRDNFPFYYDAVKWAYQMQRWADEYKYLVLKGLEPPYRPANVSVTVLFSPEVFYGAGLNNRFLVQMIAGYAVQVSSYFNFYLCFPSVFILF